jgi:transposase
MNYETKIQESVETLSRLRRTAKSKQGYKYISFIYYLKTGKAKTQKSSGELLGFGLRQSQRIFKWYKTGGILSLLKKKTSGGFGKLSSHQISMLRSRLQMEPSQSQQELINWIALSFGVKYCQSGLSRLLKRLGIKKKVSRPEYAHQDKAGAYFFKKSILN